SRMFSDRSLNNQYPSSNWSRWAVLIIISFFITVQPTGAMERPLVKSYEIENAVYRLLSQAETLMGQKKYMEAKELLDGAARNDPTSYSPSIHLDLARCLSALMDFDGSLAEANRALKFDPTCVRALYTMCLTYYQMHRYDDATRTLQKYIELCT